MRRFYGSRVADGLDRGHVGAVQTIKVRWMKRALRITPVPARKSDEMRLEILGAQHKSDLLARETGLPIEIVAPDGSVMSSEVDPTVNADR